MKKLLEQLENNTSRLEQLDQRVEQIKISRFYTVFYKEYERELEIKKTLKIKRRILNMRFTLLENIKLETTKNMYDVSSKLRELNLKTA